MPIFLDSQQCFETQTANTNLEFSIGAIENQLYIIKWIHKSEPMEGLIGIYWYITVRMQ
jgi:hypothetical protein